MVDFYLFMLTFHGISRITTRIAVAMVCMSLMGCAVVMSAPAAVGSLAVWGVTGKTPTDHVVSGVAGQDCAMTRALEQRDVCEKGVQPKVEVVNLNTQMKDAMVLR